MLVQKLNLGIMLRALQHDFRSAEAIAAMNDRHLGSEASEEDRFLHGRIAAADHDDFFSGEKETVASRAGRHTVADQLVFVGQSQPPGRSAAGDDQCLRVDLMLAEMEQERAAGSDRRW